MSFTDVNRPGGDWAPRGTNPFEDDDDDHGDDLVEQAAMANQETRRDNLEEAEAMAFQLTTRVAAYRRMVDLLGTRKDTMTHRENLRGVGEDVSVLAKRAAHVLRGHKPQGKRQKSRHRKLTRDVQQVLEEFQKAQRLCAERKAESEPVATPVKRSRRRQREREAAAEQERPLLEEDPERAERERMAQEQVAVEGELELNNAVLQEREEDIKEIQFQIGEVTEIFQDLAVLVSEQGEVSPRNQDFRPTLSDGRALTLASTNVVGRGRHGGKHSQHIRKDGGGQQGVEEGGKAPEGREVAAVHHLHDRHGGHCHPRHVHGTLQGAVSLVPSRVNKSDFYFTSCSTEQRRGKHLVRGRLLLPVVLGDVVRQGDPLLLAVVCPGRELDHGVERDAQPWAILSLLAYEVAVK